MIIKKTLLIALLTITLCDCSSKKNRQKIAAQKAQKWQNHYAPDEIITVSDKPIFNYLKPSEEMQAGSELKKLKKFNAEQDEYEQAFSRKNQNLIKDQENKELNAENYEAVEVSYIATSKTNYEETGMASWYGSNFSGNKTASGESYNIESMTAAHRKLPLSSLVRVTNLKNNKSVIVRINDRGPFSNNRIIDVSEKAAEALDFKEFGVAKVKIELLEDESEKLITKIKKSHH